MGAVRGAVQGARPGGAQPGGCDLGPTCDRMVRGRPDAWPDGPKSTGRVAGWCEAGRMGCRARSEAGPPPLPRLPRCKAETPTLARLVCRRLCGSSYARSETGSIAGALPTCGVLSVCFPLTDPSRSRSPHVGEEPRQGCWPDPSRAPSPRLHGLDELPPRRWIPHVGEEPRQGRWPDPSRARSPPMRDICGGVKTFPHSITRHLAHEQRIVCAVTGGGFDGWGWGV